MEHAEREQSPFSPHYYDRAEAILGSHGAERARRQDDLLDAALLETFPASDPISVFRLA